MRLFGLLDAERALRDQLDRRAARTARRARRASSRCSTQGPASRRIVRRRAHAAAPRPARRCPCRPARAGRPSRLARTARLRQCPAARRSRRRRSSRRSCRCRRPSPRRSRGRAAACLRRCRPRPQRRSRGSATRELACAISHATASCAATNAPVIAAVRVPPSACSTSQSSEIVRSPSARRSNTQRSERPIRRWISCVRPLCLPRAASRSPRVWVARGSMPYSAVTQPSPLPRLCGGTFSSTDAVQSTLRVAEGDQHRALGMAGVAARDRDRPQRVGGAALGALECHRAIVARGPLGRRERESSSRELGVRTSSAATSA